MDATRQKVPYGKARVELFENAARLAFPGGNGFSGSAWFRGALSTHPAIAAGFTRPTSRQWRERREPKERRLRRETMGSPPFVSPQRGCGRRVAASAKLHRRAVPLCSSIEHLLQQKRPQQDGLFQVLERVMGIEPTFLAWEATFLPLEDTRLTLDFRGVQTVVATSTVGDRPVGRPGRAVSFPETGYDPPPSLARRAVSFAIHTKEIHVCET
jgi:hypothetical protein